MLAAKGMTAAEFARQLKMHHGTLTMIQQRRPTRLPKKLDIERWSALLKLSTSEKRELLEAAGLAWSPEVIQTLVKTLRKRT
jgi:transcriptional regulator with XRE-family HTH domain